MEQLGIVKDIGPGFSPCPVPASIGPLAFQRPEEAFHSGIVGTAANTANVADQIVALRAALVLASGELATPTHECRITGERSSHCHRAILRLG